MTLAHLHVVQSLEPLQGGGLGKAALDLHQAIQLQAHTSRLATTHGQDFKQNWPDVMQWQRQGPTPLFFSNGMRHAAPRLVHEADIVHFHGFYTAPSWIFGAEVRLQGRKQVNHPHGFFEPYILQRSRWKKRFVHALFETRNMQHAGLWRALTLKEADQIRAQGITAPIVIAPNGIHLPEFDMPHPIQEKQKHRILFLGRIHPKKGLTLLIPAWAALRDRFPDWELVIAGPDELGHEAEIKQLVAQCGVTNSVSFVGPVVGPDKIALLHSADLFVLPSFSEGFSVAILEALACKVPVLATEACNFPELQSEGGGWICTPTQGNLTQSLQHALLALPSEAQDRGHAARSLIERRYTWPTIVQALVSSC